MKKPIIRPVRVDSLPERLKNDALFNNWYYEFRENKWTKPPMNPRTKGAGMANDRNTFAPMDIALKNLDADTGLGIGVFDDFVGIDIDDCVDDEGNLSPMARDIANTVKSYTEYSPSRHGIRIILRAPGFKFDDTQFYTMNKGTDGKLPLFAGKQQKLEIYVAGMTSKYVTVTGDALSPPLGVEERTNELMTVFQKYMRKGKGKRKAAQGNPTSTQKGAGAWQSTIDYALKVDRELRYFYNLPPDEARDDSADDLSLFNKLAVWLKGNRQAMCEAFQASVRGQRKKAYREDYLERTIEKALEAWENSQKNWRNECTDTGNALRFQHEYGNKYHFVTGWGWTFYNGQYWQKEDAIEHAKRDYLTLCEAMRDEALESIKQIPPEDADARKAAQKRLDFTLRSRNAKNTKDALFQAQAYMCRRAEDFDARENDLNTPGGIVDLKTSEIRQHQPEALCTNITAYEPDDGPHPMWDDFLDYITNGDAELADYLQTVAGMAAVGAVFYEGIVIAHGTGGNGKSTFFNVLHGVFGTYATTIEPELLMAKKNRSDATGLIKVKGKRYVLAAETEEGNRLSESTMKRLASTDTISSRMLYHDAIEFTPTHTLCLLTNHLPKIGSTDHGTWRRIMTVPFVRRVENDKTVIRDYARKLREKEGGQILSWIIEGAQRFLAAGGDIELPQAVMDATAEYKSSEDWMTNFLNDCCDTSSKSYTIAGPSLFTAYKRWAENNGEYVRRMQDFSKELKARGFTGRHTMRGNYWDGVKLSAEYIAEGVNTRYNIN